MTPQQVALASVAPERLEEILGAAVGVRVLVVGDLMLDIYLSGSVQRISPEAPVPVVQVQEERNALGGAANVAANVAHLGAECEVVGFVGLDGAGDQIRRALEGLDGAAVRPRLVSRIDRPTTTKTRVMARKQQIVRFDRESDDDLPEEVAAEIAEVVRAAVERVDVVVLEDYNKGVLTPTVVRAAIDTAAVAGVPVVVDPKFRHFFEYHGATVLKPNALELTSALGMPIRPDDDDFLMAARERFACEHLLVTLGDQGMLVRSEEGPTFRIPAVAREVYDVSGAGDTVTAFLAVALAAGATIHEAAVLANFAAAIEVAKPGVATVSPDEVREVVARFHAEFAA